MERFDPNFVDRNHVDPTHVDPTHVDPTHVDRIYAVKKPEYQVEANGVLEQLRTWPEGKILQNLRIFNRYDVQDLPSEYLERACHEIFSEPPVDEIFCNEEAPWANGNAQGTRGTQGKQDKLIVGVEALPGQFDQRADSAAQCLQFLTSGQRPLVRSAKIFVFETSEPASEELILKIKQFLINPVENRETTGEKPASLALHVEEPESITSVGGLIEAAGLIEVTGDSNAQAANSDAKTEKIYRELDLAMSLADFKEVQKYFQEEKRNPTLTEIRVLDTYWSDHCRHTTFHTILAEPTFVAADDTEESAKFCQEIEDSYKRYRALRKEYYGERDGARPVTLMDLGTLGAKVLAARGQVPDLDKSEEINACSVHVTVEENGEDVDYLLMFKNETHNHPTEIEPFGGAATCLGGAIRDPLSGRSYVYQAMRVTGAADPRKPEEETLQGKLSQRKIVTGAAKGYSSYGNQVGLATGLVHEIYHPDYVAKRLEVGAVIGAAPADQVIRETPEPGDVIILLGGRTGRDGIGGATGSSKEHDVHSVETSAAEVQKGNAPEERKIQRLFRKPEVSRLIKRCNDFGAGGVSVAIGELAPSLDINLDLVPLKYAGLDGTEIAISESQERMAVVLAKASVPNFIRAASEENLEATAVAEVTDTGRLRMTWRGQVIVDISREFIDSNGADQFAEVTVQAGRAPYATSSTAAAAADKPSMGSAAAKPAEDSIFERLGKQVAELNGSSQAGLSEMFDSSIGAGTVLSPFGGRTLRTPENVMAAMIPVREGVSKTTSVMSYGFNPKWTKSNPYRGSYLAVVDSVAKLWAAGVDPERIRLSFQEYFPATRDREHWGLPFQALLGALDAQLDLGAPAIGGKDSMSGSYGEYEVPPTLISFAVGTTRAKFVRSRALVSEAGAEVFLLEKENAAFRWTSDESLSYAQKVNQFVTKREAVSAGTVSAQGLLYSLFTMALGNQVGFTLDESLEESELFSPKPGAILLETADSQLKKELHEVGWRSVARITPGGTLRWHEESAELETLYDSYAKPLETVYPQKNKGKWSEPKTDRIENKKMPNILTPNPELAKPEVLIPVFPGTNCEYDSAAAFTRAGARSSIFVLQNQNPEALGASIDRLADQIDQAQILFLPGGFSGGDEPEGSAKFITAVMRNEKVRKAISRLYEDRDGLILGICNGFQALVKLGLLPDGKISSQTENSPTLTFNEIGRHVSTYVYTRIVHTHSPWLSQLEADAVYRIPISNGEGRFVANEATLKSLWDNHQVVAQYVDDQGEVTLDRPFNPSGSLDGIEALISRDGRILGKMGHSERWNKYTAKNVPGVALQDLFTAGVQYFGS